MSVTSKIAAGVSIVRKLASVPAPADLSHLTYAVNNFCNNKCVMCNIWKVYRQEPELLKQELTVSQLRAAFRKSRYLRGINYVLLTGGEPILKEDFVDIYLFLVDFNREMRIGIASNGRASSMIVRKLKQIREGLTDRGLGEQPIGIGFSLDGYAEMHDRVRGIPGLFEQVLRSAEEVSKLPNVQLALSFTIGPHNYQDFLRVHKLATDLGVGLAYRCVQTSPIYYRNEGVRDGWQPEQLRELGDVLHSLEERRYLMQPFLRKLVDMNSYYNEMMLEYERAPRRLFECSSGTQSVFLDAYGNVLPCIIRDGAFGNIKRASFDEIWESEQAASVRRSIAAHECHCWVDCEVNPNLGREPKAYLYNIKRLLSHVTS